MGPALDSAVTKYAIETSPYKITKELMYQAVVDLEEYNKTHWFFINRIFGRGKFPRPFCLLLMAQLINKKATGF